jgi:hypothetical protein
METKDKEEILVAIANQRKQMAEDKAKLEKAIRSSRWQRWFGAGFIALSFVNVVIHVSKNQFDFWFWTWGALLVLYVHLFRLRDRFEAQGEIISESYRFNDELLGHMVKSVTSAKQEQI